MTLEPANSVTIELGGQELFDRVRPLWHELRDHHAELAPVWKAEILAPKFEDRIERLLKSAGQGLLVLLASSDGRDVGYCICTIDDAGQGELSSIVVTAAERGRGIGRALMKAAMQWFGERSPRTIIIDVLAANESAQRLYREFGFQPRTMVMRHVGE